MPKLNERKSSEPTIGTYLRLPVSTRAELESAIGHDGIRSLTQAVVRAAKMLAAKKSKSNT